MAKTISFTQGTLIGKLVYEAFRPNKPGIVIKAPAGHEISAAINHILLVQWLGGEQSEVHLYELKDFDALIEDHLRKASNQTKLRNQLLKEAVKQ